LHIKYNWARNSLSKTTVGADLRADAAAEASAGIANLFAVGDARLPARLIIVKNSKYSLRRYVSILESYLGALAIGEPGAS
jgi:hypothetical protein